MSVARSELDGGVANDRNPMARVWISLYDPSFLSFWKLRKILCADDNLVRSSVLVAAIGVFDQHGSTGRGHEAIGRSSSVAEKIGISMIKKWSLIAGALIVGAS